MKAEISNVRVNGVRNNVDNVGNGFKKAIFSSLKKVSNICSNREQPLREITRDLLVTTPLVLLSSGGLPLTFLTSLVACGVSKQTFASMVKNTVLSYIPCSSLITLASVAVSAAQQSINDGQRTRLAQLISDIRSLNEDGKEIIINEAGKDDLNELVSASKKLSSGEMHKNSHAIHLLNKKHDHIIDYLHQMREKLVAQLLTSIKLFSDDGSRRGKIYDECLNKEASASELEKTRQAALTLKEDMGCFQFHSYYNDNNKSERAIQYINPLNKTNTDFVLSHFPDVTFENLMSYSDVDRIDLLDKAIDVARSKVEEVLGRPVSAAELIMIADLDYTPISGVETEIYEVKIKEDKKNKINNCNNEINLSSSKSSNDKSNFIFEDVVLQQYAKKNRTEKNKQTTAQDKIIHQLTNKLKPKFTVSYSSEIAEIMAESSFAKKVIEKVSEDTIYGRKLGKRVNDRIIRHIGLEGKGPGKWRITMKRDKDNIEIESIVDYHNKTGRFVKYTPA